MFHRCSMTFWVCSFEKSRTKNDTQKRHIAIIKLTSFYKLYSCYWYEVRNTNRFCVNNLYVMSYGLPWPFKIWCDIGFKQIARVTSTRTNVKRTRKRVMSPIIRPREICSGPSTSKAGMRYVVRAILITLATANSTSDTISGSSGLQSNRAVKKPTNNQ